MTIEQELKALQKRVEQLESSKPKKEKKERKARPPTAYQAFVKEQMVLVKDNNPEVAPKERMGFIAKLWKEREA